ncbi:SDR family oxidoreductase [Streptomyces diastaticus]|uniref:SDR family oxidoreductase n=1 Tax=Streptomyces TaxID=1883 RepID=UPI0027875C79|nr:SDR family oxidoreductase [Streptomyces sp. DSM 41037]MDQ0297204.1 NAD(P)-dependent dehydrogenase (short-subunit alcohol dehydrogenase family) [Streptomyces sp. DSM 41037]
MAGTILITGAGSGFGKEVALRLAAGGHDVIAGVEIIAQVSAVRAEARERGVTLRVEKLDVTDPGDRARALDWDVEVLLNNAGVAEGGSTVDIPAARLRRQFEVNVIGPVLLTQPLAKRMAERGSGRIVFMSSVAGLTVDPFTGAYAASKHAVEAFADALDQELAEFGVTVATINPGPFLTGFNDTMFETWKEWRDDPAGRLFDYERLAFPHEQYDPEPVYATTVRVLLGEDRRYRHLLPEEMEPQARDQVAAQWDRELNNGRRPALVQKAHDIVPATPVRQD